MILCESVSSRDYVSCVHLCDSLSNITMAGTIIDGYFWTDCYNNEVVISDIAIIFNQLYIFTATCSNGEDYTCY